LPERVWLARRHERRGFVSGRHGSRPGQEFRAIGEDLKHTYTLTYYPAPNPNTGRRQIEIKVPAGQGDRYRINARNGYWPHRQEGEQDPRGKEPRSE
jgi:hypothetical protein